MEESAFGETIGLAVGLVSVTCTLVTAVTCSPLSWLIFFVKLPLLTAVLSFVMTSAEENTLTDVMVYSMVTCALSSHLARITALKLLTLTATPITDVRVDSSAVRNEEALTAARVVPCRVCINTEGGERIETSSFINRVRCG